MFLLNRWSLAMLALTLAVPLLAARQAHALTYVDEVTASNPQYWYRFEGATTGAGVPNQGSTAGFNGTYGAGFNDGNLGMTSAYSSLGSAIEFTGPAANNTTTKFVDFGANIPELINLRPPSVDKTTSVEYWINTAQSGSNAGQNWRNPSLLARESPGDGDMYWGNIPQSGTGDFRFSTSDINDITVPGVANGQWHHVVMVKEWHQAGTSVSTLYIDGGASVGGRTVVVNTPAGNPSYQDGDAGINRLGLTIAGELGDVQYIGKVDEVAIYNRALTAAEVKSHYTAAAGTLVGLYRFENAGNIGQDSGPRGNNLTANGSAAQSGGGVFGNALSLDGDGDFLGNGLGGTAGLPTLSVGNGSYAITAFFKPDAATNAVGAQNGIVGWGNYGTGNQVTAIRMNGANGFNHYWWANDQTPGGLPNLVDGNYHHVAVMFDADTGARSLYLDGILVAQDFPVGHNAMNVNFAVGKTFSNEFFDGMLDDVAIFNRALTLQELNAIRNGDFSAFLDNGQGVPEPASALLALIGMAALARRRRAKA